MLLVSSYSPIPKTYDNRNINSFKRGQNSCHVQSFMSKTPTLPYTGEKYEWAVKTIMEKYSDVLGLNFKKKWLEPMTEFLKSNNMFILHDTKTSHLRTGPGIEGVDFQVYTAAFAEIETRRPLHQQYFNDINRDIRPRDVIVNSSKIDLVMEFINRELRQPEEKLFSAFESMPVDLKNNTIRIKEALDEFYHNWFMLDYGNCGKKQKIEVLKNAHKVFLP